MERQFGNGFNVYFATGMLRLINFILILDDLFDAPENGAARNAGYM